MNTIDRKALAEERVELKQKIAMKGPALREAVKAATDKVNGAQQSLDKAYAELASAKLAASMPDESRRLDKVQIELERSEPAEIAACRDWIEKQVEATCRDFHYSNKVVRDARLVALKVARQDLRDLMLEGLDGQELRACLDRIRAQITAMPMEPV